MMENVVVACFSSFPVTPEMTDCWRTKMTRMNKISSSSRGLASSSFSSTTRKTLKSSYWLK